MPIPQPKGWPVVGNLPQLAPLEPVQSLMRIAAQHGGIFRLDLMMEKPIFLGSQALVHDACDETRFVKYLVRPIRILRDVVGDGLFTAETHELNWGRAHRILMPAFGPTAMRAYFDDMLDIAEQMFTKWTRLGAKAPIDVSDDMTRLTLDTIALCGMGYRFNSFYQRDMHPFVQAMVHVLCEGNARARRAPWHNALLLAKERQFARDRALLYKVTEDVIREHHTADRQDGRKNLLTLMLTGRDPSSDVGLDVENIQKQLITFLIAGHETTSGLLSFAMALLLKHPAVAERARSVVDGVFGKGPPKFEHLAQLGYIEQILKETLRLYPTAPAFAVSNKEDTLLAKRYPLPRGSSLIVLLPVLHRDPQVWPQPEAFNPDRFDPARRDAILPHAWLPFGHGVRACLGRAFAMQEATLVLAMLLHRFDVTSCTPYELQIQETLTLKPVGLRIFARPRLPTVRATGATLNATAHISLGDAKMARHETPLRVLYGSNTGTCEALARRMASDGDARGYATSVATLNHDVAALPSFGVLAVICGSYNGEPPDNARAFAAWVESLPATSLTNTLFVLFGCGDRNWASTYQQVPRRLYQALAQAGAKPLMPMGEADAAGDFFGDFDRWYDTTWQTLAHELGVTAKRISTTGLYEVTLLPHAPTPHERADDAAQAKLLQNRELVDMTWPYARSRRHLEIALPAGQSFEAGDYLAILPHNGTALVAQATRHFALDPETVIALRSRRGAMAASLPLEQPMTVRALLSEHVELAVPATRRDIERLARRCTHTAHRDHLTSIATDEALFDAEILQKRLTVLDVLNHYPSLEVAFADYLEFLPAMRARQYSIASSPRLSPTTCALTVAVMDRPALSGHGRFRGTCSSYLADLAPGAHLSATIKRPNAPLHPPADNTTPMLMICAGSGIAPLRSFMQDRMARHAAGERAGPMSLFFGCSHPEIDFLYRDELLAWEAGGHLTLFTAFSRRPEGDVRYIQHRLWQQRVHVMQAITGGATTFLCGDASRMAKEVMQTLARIYQEARQIPAQAASAWLTELEATQRFVRDVFT